MNAIRVFDAFTFYNELDLLEIRLGELAHIVDRFVIVEATHTFTGDPKPLYFEEHRERYKRWLDKIEHVVVEFPQILSSPDAGPWARERYQRDQISRGLACAAPADAVLISDVDEIPKPFALGAALKLGSFLNSLVVFEAREFNYTLDLYNPTVEWRRGPRLAARRLITSPEAFRRHNVPVSKRLDRMGLDCLAQRLRTMAILGRPVGATVLPEAAWHFTYLGDQRQFADKIRAFSHQELNTPEIIEPSYFNLRASRRLSVHSKHDDKLCLAPPDELPKYVRANASRFAHVLSPETRRAFQGAAQ
jgi:beta-1,4-mannosyl-glycoprotein beta-1,4-N-acetylglucosaminyltransferase